MEAAGGEVGDGLGFAGAPADGDGIDGGGGSDPEVEDIELALGVGGPVGADTLELDTLVGLEGDLGGHGVDSGGGIADMDEDVGLPGGLGVDIAGEVPEEVPLAEVVITGEDVDKAVEIEIEGGAHVSVGLTGEGGCAVVGTREEASFPVVEEKDIGNTLLEAAPAVDEKVDKAIVIEVAGGDAPVIGGGLGGKGGGNVGEAVTVIAQEDIGNVGILGLPVGNDLIDPGDRGPDVPAKVDEEEPFEAPLAIPQVTEVPAALLGQLGGESHGIVLADQRGLERGIVAGGSGPEEEGHLSLKAPVGMEKVAQDKLVVPDEGNSVLAGISLVTEVHAAGHGIVLDRIVGHHVVGLATGHVDVHVPVVVDIGLGHGDVEIGKSGEPGTGDIGKGEIIVTPQEIRVAPRRPEDQVKDMIRIEVGGQGPLGVDILEDWAGLVAERPVLVVPEKVVLGTVPHPVAAGVDRDQVEVPVAVEIDPLNGPAPRAKGKSGTGCDFGKLAAVIAMEDRWLRIGPVATPNGGDDIDVTIPIIIPRGDAMQVPALNRGRVLGEGVVLVAPEKVGRNDIVIVGDEVVPAVIVEVGNRRPTVLEGRLSDDAQCLGNIIEWNTGPLKRRKPCYLMVDAEESVDLAKGHCCADRLHPFTGLSHVKANRRDR